MSFVSIVDKESLHGRRIGLGADRRTRHYADDGVSASKTSTKDQPGWQLMAHRRPWDAVVIWKDRLARRGGLGTSGLAYNINIQLPESRDPAVYNAIFKALREHFR